MSLHTVILGLGNILYADEGIGVRAAEYLHKAYTFPSSVEIVDGGTQGLALLDYVERADRLLVLDAVDFGLAPGTVVCKGAAEVPRYLTGQKHSVHQNSFSEVLALAALRDAAPKDLVLIGMHPVSLSLGGTLSDIAKTKGLPAMVSMALHTLHYWHILPMPSLHSRSLHEPCLRMEAFM